MLPLLYIVRMDVEPDYLDEFVKWYDTRHGPDLIGAGLHSCNAYHSVLGGPLICNVYEVPDVEVFSARPYVAVRENDSQLVDEVLHKISNHSNTVYEQKATVGVSEEALKPGTSPSRAGAVRSPVVSTMRFDIPSESESSFCQWFERTEARRQQIQPGFISTRLAKQSGKHPLFPSSQPEWVVLTEWANLSSALDDGTTEEAIERYTHAAESVSRLEYNVATLSATLLNAETWAP